MSELYDLNEKDIYLTSTQPPAIVKVRTMETFPSSTIIPRPPSTVPFDISSPSASAAKFDIGSPPLSAVRIQRDAVKTDPRLLLADIMSSQASAKALSEVGDSEKLLRVEEQLDDAVACTKELQSQLSILREQHRSSLSVIHTEQQIATTTHSGTVTALYERIKWWEDTYKCQAAEHNARLLTTVAERDAKQLSLTASESSLTDARETVEKILLREENLKSKSVVHSFCKVRNTRLSYRNVSLNVTRRSYH